MLRMARRGYTFCAEKGERYISVVSVAGLSQFTLSMLNDLCAGNKG